MANGTAALQLFTPEPLPAVADKPATSMEVEIGKAVAAGVIAIAIAAHDYVDRGAMTVSSRTWAGGMLGHVAQLRLDTLGEIPDFVEVAFTEGRRAMQGRPDGVLLARFGKERVDEVITELIGYVIAIAEKVANDELRLRAN